MKKKLFIAISVIATFIACEKPADEADLLKKVVVQGYLFEGEPVDDIRLSHLLPFGGEDSVAQPINDADVRIIWKGNSYLLEPAPGDSGMYHYTGSVLQVIEDETYTIEIDYFGKTASGTTTVPPQPTGVTVSKDSIDPLALLDSIFSGNFEFEPQVVNWNNPGREYHYVVVNNIDPDPQLISGFFLGNLFLLTQPTQEDYFEVYDYLFTHYGKHEARVYRINKEYVDLYITQDQDSRTLNEPLTNIRNGLGVFSAFNSSAATFHVVDL